MTALLLSLGSAATFGAADFLGGLASRKAHAIPVALLSQVVGLVVLLGAMLVLPGRLSAAAFAWGLAAGLGGAGGLMLYFRALSIGAMGVTAPVASLVGAAIPVGVGLGLGERPEITAAAGIVLGVVATVLVSRPADADPTADPAAQRAGLIAAAAAGVLFGFFFVALDRAPDDSGLWPLVGARVAGMALLLGVLALRRPARPARDAVGFATVSGLLDMAANVLFLLATREGLLVLTSVVTGLYPVGVVVLAWLVLRERLGRVQLLGVGLALSGTALIAM
ncbi:EamA family transporter [Euzebya sp.]|uniref:EamA family transporter n=1 Tax=Euzebya sp. TaxID=1971409 RepID=UPI0035123576